MKILMVSSEMTPFAKTGGLADVVGALPKALVARGHEVWVVVPKYSAVDSHKHRIEPFHQPMGVWMGEAEEWCAVHKTVRDGVQIHFIDHQGYFDRWGLYHDQWHNDYDDNPRRFGFLSRAAVQLCLDKGFQPDVIHVNDWQSSLLPAYLRTWDWGENPIGDCPALLTIHNMAYQGVYPKSHYHYLGMGWEHFRADVFESFDAINMLKGGIYFADVVNTVSPTYAEETRNGQGYGLESFLHAKGERYLGILNGVDYITWNPETDPFIPHRYCSQWPAGKLLCKQALQRRMGLEVDDNVALFGTVGRLVEQKGLTILAEALEGMLWTMQIQLALLGSGDKGLEHQFGTLAARYPGRVGVYFGFSEELAHLVEAGSDFFLMPSLFEPCGLNQLYSLRYGTLPVVRSVGGLNDTIENYDEATGNGTGFKFYDFSAHALYSTVGWAVSTYYDRPAHITKMRETAMGRRFTWDMSAIEYLKAYQAAIDHRKTVVAQTPAPTPPTKNPTATKTKTKATTKTDKKTLKNGKAEKK